MKKFLKNFLKKYFIFLIILMVAIILSVGLREFWHIKQGSSGIKTPFYRTRLWIAKKKSRLSGSDPIYYLDHAKLTQKLSCPKPTWAVRQIAQDFKTFKQKNHAYTPEELKHIARAYDFSGRNRLVWVQFKDDQVFLEPTDPSVKNLRSYKVLSNIFQYFAKQKYIQNLNFVCCLEDFLQTEGVSYPEDLQALPILAFAKDVTTPIEKNTILVPDWMNLRGWPDLKPRLDIAKQYFPWAQKKSKIYWRGTRSDVSGLRNAIVTYSRNRPTDPRLDADFTQVDKIKNKTIINPVEQNSRHIPPEDHLEFKYQLCIDGATATWERFVWQLDSNSTVLKHDSNKIQWFYGGIRPFREYYPVKTDPAAVLEAFEDLEKNPDLAQKIALQGEQFAKTNLSLEDMLAYWIWVLQTYREIINV